MATGLDVGEGMGEGRLGGGVGRGRAGGSDGVARRRW